MTSVHKILESFYIIIISPHIYRYTHTHHKVSVIFIFYFDLLYLNIFLFLCATTLDSKTSLKKVYHLRSNIYGNRNNRHVRKYFDVPVCPFLLTISLHYMNLSQNMLTVFFAGCGFLKFFLPRKIK